MIESMHPLGNQPKIYLITVSIGEIKPMIMELSEEVAESIPAVIKKINELIKAEQG